MSITPVKAIINEKNERVGLIGIFDKIPETHVHIGRTKFADYYGDDLRFMRAGECVTFYNKLDAVAYLKLMRRLKYKANFRTYKKTYTVYILEAPNGNTAY